MLQHINLPRGSFSGSSNKSLNNAKNKQCAGSIEKISNITGFVTTWKSSVGVGAYTIAYLFYEASPIIGFIMYTSVVAVTSYTTLLMVDCHDAIVEHRKKNNDDNTPLSYPEIAQFYLGPFGFYVSFLSLTIGLWGSLVVYVVFIEQNLYKFTAENELIFNVNHFKDYYIAIALFPILMIFSFFDNIKKLTIINIFSLLSLFVVICIVLIHSFADSNNVWTINNADNTLLRLPTLQSLVISFGLSTFCMEGLIMTAIPIYESLKYSEYYNFKRILIKAMICFILSYSFFGILCCFQYKKPLSSILLNFNNNLLIYDIISYCCCLSVLFTYPMVNYVLYQMIEQSLFGNEYFNTKSKKYIFRAMIILSTIFVAIFVPDYGAFISFVGCIGNGFAIYWIPTACYLMKYHNGFGILWLNCILCCKCCGQSFKIKTKEREKFLESKETDWLLINVNNKNNNKNDDKCNFGKYIALTILIIGFISSIIGVYVSIGQEIS